MYYILDEKITIFFKIRFNHIMIFFKLVDYYKINVYITHNNCLEHYLQNCHKTYLQGAFIR